jgi:hypothetical protein
VSAVGSFCLQVALRTYWLDLPSLAREKYDAARIIIIVISPTINEANTYNLRLDTEAALDLAVDIYVRRKS